MEPLTFFTDGGCRKNPGPAASAVYFPGSNSGFGKFIGNSRTNNEAEAEAFIAALDYARSKNVRVISAFSDSQLLVHLVTGKWRATAQNIQDLLDRIDDLLPFFTEWSITWVPRAQNVHADWVCNQVLDKLEKGERVTCLQFSTIPSLPSSPSRSG